MLNKDPSKRPLIKELKKDQFFNDIDWRRLSRREINPPIILSKDNLKKDTDEQKMLMKKENDIVIINIFIYIYL